MSTGRPKKRSGRNRPADATVAVRLRKTVLDRVQAMIPEIQRGTPHRVTQQSAVEHLIDLALQELKKATKFS